MILESLGPESEVFNCIYDHVMGQKETEKHCDMCCEVKDKVLTCYKCTMSYYCQPCLVKLREYPKEKPIYEDPGEKKEQEYIVLLNYNGMIQIKTLDSKEKALANYTPHDV